MKAVLGSLQDSFIRGVLFLAPVFVFGLLISKALGLVRGVVEPFTRTGPLAELRMPGLITAGVLVVICLLAGLLSRSRGARRVTEWLESKVLHHIPGYAYMKGMGEGMAGVGGVSSYQPVLARIEDSWQLGFIVETIEPGQYAVYVPGAPSPWSGAVYFMAEDRIRRVDLRLADVQNCLKNIGIGSTALLRGKLQYP
jgi:uncharacterized membrane protein